MKEIGFLELYEIAKSKLNPRKISSLIEAGGVSAAILTENGNIYWSMYRYCLFIRNVCGKKCYCKYDYKWGK